MLHKDRYFLGIHTGHDRGASILKNGKLVGHIAEDRLDRIKHSETQELPYKAIDAMLILANISIKDITAIGLSCVNRSSVDYRDYYESILQDHYDTQIPPIYLAQHHLCHALCCSLINPEEENFVYVFDGAGDLVNGKMESETLFRITPEHEEVLHQRFQDYHESFVGKSQFYYYELMYDDYKKMQVSLGKKYNQITHRVGFSAFQDGKTMGLAPFGKSLFDVREISASSLDFDLKIEDLFKQFAEIRATKGMSFQEFDLQYQQDMAATMQEYLEQSLLGITTDISKRFGIKQIGLVGGVALNCVANYKIHNSDSFNKVYPFPAAGDDGQSIGAAIYAARKSGDSTTNSNFQVYIGLSHENDIVTTLDSYRLSYEYLETDELIELISQKINTGQVIGLLRGRSEVGPRALGHRSILASATHPKMRDILNSKVKFRELFRPYAPMVLESEAQTIFDLNISSPYMLYACPVKKEFQSKLPSITHVDGTARVQTVSESQEPFIAALLLKMKEASGLPVILNTSFNLAGEPMVETPKDAIETFLRTRIDLLVLENYIVDRSANQV